jgi:hypothetical protein
MELGILKTFTPRKMWEHEERNFTPWLVENIDELSKAVGIELEVEKTEVAAGTYSADILAKDTETGKFVVIENQLEKINHDHLGKAITYASVLDASTIIWVASDFTEEHKRALDWLNDQTNDEISFYGVQLELWQIDESKLALRFNLISKPNLAVREAVRSITMDELSDTKKFQYNFWIKFRDKLSETKKIPSLHTPRPQYWFNVAIGKVGIYISNTCNTEDQTICIKIYILRKIADVMFPYLESRKGEIEEYLGESLSWNPNPDKRDKIILLSRPTDFSSLESTDEAIDWLAEKTVNFREVFSKMILEAP